MCSDLEILESLILNKLLSIDPETATITTLEEILSSIRNEAKKVKHNIPETYFHAIDLSRFGFYIHEIQQQITSLADQVYNSNLSEETILAFHPKDTLTFKGLHVNVYIILEDILNTVEFQFSQYFNLETPIPNRIRFIAVRQFTDKLTDLNNYKGSIHPKLFEIIIKPVNEFINNPSLSTYSSYYYLQKYLNEIFKFKESGKVRVDLSNYLKRKLIYLNFNHLSFFNFITSEITNDVGQIEEIPDKLERLSWYLKETNQTLVTPGLGYVPNLFSIKELISEWIKEEVDHFKKVHFHVFSHKVVPQDEQEEIFKLITNLSVPEYAFFLRCLVEVGLYQNKGQRQITALTQLFALNTQTKGTREIAPGSLRKNYYLDDPKSIETVKNLILKILSYINSL